MTENSDNDMRASILQMKRQALQAKKEGNIEQAKQYLEEAKLMELYAVGVDQLEDPNDLKKLAVYLKQNRNDVEGAKAALQRAQKLEQQSQEDPVMQAMEQATLDELTTSTKKIQFTVEEMLDVETLQDMKNMDMPIPSREEYAAQAMDCKRQAVQAKQAGDMTTAKQHLLQSKKLEAAMERLHPTTTVQALQEEEIYSEEDNALLQELMGMANGNDMIIGGDNDNDHAALEALFDNDGNTIEVDDLDDLDADMLQDMMEAGMNIPTVEEIEQQAKEKKLLAAQFHKQQNIIAAKAALAESKRLQGKAQELSDMLRAIQVKKEQQANAADPEAMLEALMAASEKKTKATTATTVSSEQPKEEPLLSSAEYRAMALEYKEKKDLQQAKIALINYKKALAKEQDAAMQQQKEQVMSILETKEIPMAIQQQRLFAYYQRLVDETLGTMQYSFWKNYQERCQDALEQLQQSTTHTQTTKQIQHLCQNQQLRTMKDSHGNPILEMANKNDLSFCGTSCDPSTTGFEIAILDVTKLLDNKTLKKMMRKNKSLPIHIQVVISIALPQTEMEDSPNLDNIILDQWTMTTSKGDSFTNTDKSTIMLPLERGSSRYAKTLVKRMGRRRMTIQVYHVHPKPQPKTTTSFLFFSKTKLPDQESLPPPTLLGSVAVELSHFLEHNYLAGDFPLMDSSRRNEVGGSMQLAIRTCQPFDPKENEHAALMQMIPQEQVVTGLTVKFTTMKPYGALSALLLSVDNADSASSSLEQ